MTLPHNARKYVRRLPSEGTCKLLMYKYIILLEFAFLFKLIGYEFISIEEMFHI